MSLLTEGEGTTQKSYDNNFREWMEHSGGLNRKCYWEKEMAEYLSYLGMGKEVLEVGCGPATDGKYLLESGCSRVVSIDYSMGMLSLAKGIHKNSFIKPHLCSMDIYHLGFPDNMFDGFWASASLLHLENTQPALKEIARVTRPGGVGFISIKEGEGKSVDPKLNYLFVYFTEKEFDNLIMKSGMERIIFKKRPGYSGHDWLTYIIKVMK